MQAAGVLDVSVEGMEGIEDIESIEAVDGIKAIGFPDTNGTLVNSTAGVCCVSTSGCLS